MNVDKSIINQICKVASQFEYIEKVILFGSRARGDNRERSDIDLAVYTEQGITEFVYILETQVNTLLEFDISNMRETNDLCFKEQVEKEGIVLYEKSTI